MLSYAISRSPLQNNAPTLENFCMVSILSKTPFSPIPLDLEFNNETLHTFNYTHKNTWKRPHTNAIFFAQLKVYLFSD